MCFVSYVGDVWTDRLRTIPQIDTSGWSIRPEATAEEVAALREEVRQMREELLAAKRQDEEEGNADCEMAEKVHVLRAVADALGISLEDVFPE